MILMESCVNFFFSVLNTCSIEERMNIIYCTVLNLPIRKWRFRNLHVYLENNQCPNIVPRNELGRLCLYEDIVIFTRNDIKVWIQLWSLPENYIAVPTTFSGISPAIKTHKVLCHKTLLHKASKLTSTNRKLYS